MLVCVTCTDLGDVVHWAVLHFLKINKSFSQVSFKLTNIVCNSWHKSNMIKNVICLSPVTAIHFQNKVSWGTPACAKVTLAGCLQWHSLKFSRADQSSRSWQVESDNMLDEHTVCFNGNEHRWLFNVFWGCPERLHLYLTLCTLYVTVFYWLAFVKSWPGAPATFLKSLGCLYWAIAWMLTIVFSGISFSLSSISHCRVNLI